MCSGGCANGGTCIDPDLCQCVEGWTGANCGEGNFYNCSPYYITVCHQIYIDVVDINECSSNNGGCSDQCVNTPGSYSCQCRQYATLGSDGHTCTCPSVGFIQNDVTTTCDGQLSYYVHVRMYACE